MARSVLWGPRVNGLTLLMALSVAAGPPQQPGPAGAAGGATSAKLQALPPTPPPASPPPAPSLAPPPPPDRETTPPKVTGDLEPGSLGPPTRAMTLDDAIGYAREHQPSLVAARARLLAVQADADVPRALYMPRVTATAQAFAATSNDDTATYTATYGIDLPRVGATQIDTSGWKPYPSTLGGIGLRQEIFDFGRIAALEAAADARVEAEKGLTDTVRLDVIYAVESGYYAVQTAKGVLAAADAAYRRSKLNYDTASAGVDAGLREPIEMTRAEADLGRFDVARVRARAGVAAAQAVFAAVVGVPETLLDASGREAPPPPYPSLDAAIRQALQRDPLIRSRRARVTQQHETTTAIAAELRPDISLTSTVSERAGGAPTTAGVIASGGGYLPNTPNWDAGLVFTWPIVDFAVKARESASRSLEGAREAEVAEQVQILSARVQEVYVRLVSAQEALPALVKTLGAARANYDQAEARFKNDLGTAVELADAQALLTTAEVDVTIGTFELMRARASLARVVAENL